MSDPILFLVDDRPRVLEALARDLGRRFGGDHRIVAEGSPSAALEALEGLARRGEEVALVVAGQQMAELPGVLLLLRAHELHPGAKRVLLVGRREWTPANPAVRAMTLGQIDTYLFEPWLPVGALPVPAGQPGPGRLGADAGTLVRGDPDRRAALGDPLARAARHADPDGDPPRLVPGRLGRRAAAAGGGRPGRLDGSRWWCSTAARCSSTPPTPSWPRRWGSGPGRRPGPMT